MHFYQLCGNSESSLKKAPLTLEDFKAGIKAETYGTVKDAWQEEAKISRTKSKAMMELKKLLMPKIYEEIKAQRLSFMESGMRFSKYGKELGGKDRNKVTYCKLDNSHKVLHYKEINENDPDPSYEELLKEQHSIPVSNITGKLGFEQMHLKEM